MCNDEAIIRNINIWRTRLGVFACSKTYIIHYRPAYSFNTFWLISPSDFIYLREIHGAFIYMMFNCKKSDAERLYRTRTRDIARFFNYRKLEMARVIFISDILRHVAVWMRKRALRCIDFSRFFFLLATMQKLKSRTRVRLVSGKWNAGRFLLKYIHPFGN